MDLRKTAIISLCSIYWSVFVTEMECVYCAVRTEYLNVIQVNIDFAYQLSISSVLEQMLSWHRNDW